jgi:hypothetical protein
MSASCDESPTRAETDASTASWTVEDVGKKSKKLRKASKRIRKRSEQISQQNSPKEARDELHDPGGEADAPGDPESDPQGPRGGDTNAPGRATGPGGHLEWPGESRGAEVDLEHRKVTERAGYDWIRTRIVENERVGDTSALRRDTRPGGHPGEQVGSAGVQDNRERRDDGIGVGYDGNRCRMDGATSSTRRESKRLETRMLAEQKNVSKSGTSARWRTYLGHPYHLQVTPGRSPIMSTHSGPVDDSRRNLEESVPTEGLTRSCERVKVESGESKRSDTLHMDRRCRRSGPGARIAETRPLEPIEDGPHALRQHHRCTSRDLPYLDTRAAN